jgi:UDP-glucose 4-epimerase
MIKNCNVLVTGGAGFIGSHLATRLAEANKVVIFDIFTTGRRSNIEHLQDNPNVKILLIDVRDKDPLMKYSSEGFDYIFHLAAQASVPLSIEDPIYTTDNNITGTLNILQSAKDLGGCKVIFSSSSAVYGDAPQLPKHEGMPTLPKSPYAVTKISGEQYCRVFYELYNLPTVTLRYFNVYGPNQDPNSQYAAVVPNFIQSYLENQPPVIYGDGEQSRDLVYVQDVVDANLAAAESEKANGEIINIASGKSMTVNLLAEKLGSIARLKELTPVHKSPREGDIRHSYADISKAKELLNWTPSIEIDKGLGDTFKFFRSKHDKPVNNSIKTNLNLKNIV